MKLKTAAVLILAVLASLILSSCATNQGGSRNESMAASRQVKFTTQNITSMASIKTPDEIVYYHDGKQDSFTKNNTKFSNIIKLNAQRGGSSLEMLKSAMTISKSPESDNNLIMLEYKYFSGRASLYFPLNEPKDGQYYAAQQTSLKGDYAQNYGYLSPPDELLQQLQ